MLNEHIIIIINPWRNCMYMYFAIVIVNSIFLFASAWSQGFNR